MGLDKAGSGQSRGAISLRLLAPFLPTERRTKRQSSGALSCGPWPREPPRSQLSNAEIDLRSNLVIGHLIQIPSFVLRICSWRWNPDLLAHSHFLRDEIGIRVPDLLFR